MNHVDHILIAVDDLEAGAARLLDRYGLAALPGGSPWPGITNRVVPLGPPAYLELVAATEPDACDEASMIRDFAAEGDRLLTWVIEPDDFDAVVARTGAIPSGDADSSWRTLGGVRPDRPFFIRYSKDRAARREGWQKRLNTTGHRVMPGEIKAITVGGEVEWVRAWVGELDVPLTVEPGQTGLLSVEISTVDGGSIRLGDA
ncbi:MAG TPA: VOC family protein [Thermomicrobiales bacterium]|jgi:hypothetical protein|nr:VOC family protein [Thermomicrobiales bacterium]